MSVSTAIERMTRNLDSIPYDVFYSIASTLDPSAVVHLSRVNRALYRAMHSEPIARKTIHVCHPISLEEEKS